MGFYQRILSRSEKSNRSLITVGDTVVGGCDSHLYHSGICSVDSEYIGAYSTVDYYTYWSIVWICITLGLILLAIPFSRKFVGCNKALNKLVYPFIVAGLGNSITVGVISQLFLTNLKIKTPNGSPPPELIDFYASSVISESNFWAHIFPMFMCFVCLFLMRFIKVDKKLTFKRLFLSSSVLLLVIFSAWFFIPAEVKTEIGEIKNVWGIEKLKYTYSIPPEYIYVLFPLLELGSLAALSYSFVY